jgi:hypothetical protein
MGAGWDNGQSVICVICGQFKGSADYADYGCAESADSAGLREMGAGWDNGRCVICGHWLIVSS